jgi:carbon storage regulator
MLVLSRKRKERIVIDNRIVVTIVSIGLFKVKIGIDAPDEVSIERAEIACQGVPGEQSLPNAESSGHLVDS